MAIVFIFQIPSISEALAKECVAVSVVNGVASESIFCKGIVENADGDFFVNVQISEEDISKVTIGKSAKITCKALGDKILNGEVIKISDFAYKVTYGGVSMTVVDAVISLNTSYKGLKSGYSATAEIIYTEVENAAILPYECVAKEKDGKYYVYKVENNWAVKEYINVAFEDEKGAVISGKCDFDTVCEEPENFFGDYVRIKNVGID